MADRGSGADLCAGQLEFDPPHAIEVAASPVDLKPGPMHEVRRKLCRETGKP